MAPLELWELAIVTAPQTSDAVAGGTLTVDCRLLWHSMTIGAGQAIEGGVVSRTVTGVWPLSVFSEPSVAVKVTVVVPSG